MAERRSIFVFGSNMAGRHGKGAALFARTHHGAVHGQGEGIQGNSYAIPTKGDNLEPLSLFRIRQGVTRFLFFAKDNPDLDFQVTRVGCGLAGYTDKQISPFFEGAPSNCNLPPEWINLLSAVRGPQKSKR